VAADDGDIETLDTELVGLSLQILLGHRLGLGRLDVMKAVVVGNFGRCPLRSVRSSDTP
jgi:hypothetical protein